MTDNSTVELGIVTEVCIWEYGKKKPKAKVNIPVLMPLQKLTKLTTLTRLKGKNSKKFVVPKTQNYVELYLPDHLFTYPANVNVKKTNKELAAGGRLSAGRTTVTYNDASNKKCSYSNRQWNAITSILTADDIMNMTGKELTAVAKAAGVTSKNSKGPIKLVRFVKAYTKLSLSYMEGSHDPDAIKVLGKYDDYNDDTYLNKNIKATGLSKEDYVAATR